MTGLETKEYLKNVFELEKQIYTLNLTIQQLTDKAKWLAIPNAVEKPKWKKVSDDVGFFQSIVLVLSLIRFPIISGGLILLFLVLGVACEELLLPVFLIIVGIIVVLAGVITIICSADGKKKEKAIREENTVLKREYYSRLEKEKERIEKETIQKDSLNEDIVLLKTTMEKCKNTLEKLYGLDIVHPKYRNFVTITMLYEYFDTGRCESLGGHEGAYNVYENEIRMNLIITKLDDVIKQLETIQQNQYMMYEAIQDSNRITQKLCQSSEQNMRLINDQNAKLDKLAGNSDLIAYNSQVAAENTQILKYIELYDKRVNGTLPTNYIKMDK